MLRNIRKAWRGLFKSHAEKIIQKALDCKTLSELIQVQPVVVVQYRRGNMNQIGKFLTLVDYLRRGLSVEIIAPRITVQFHPVPTIDSRELPKYCIFISINDRWYDTQLLLVAGAENKMDPVIVHKSEHFGLFNPVNLDKDPQREQLFMTHP